MALAHEPVAEVAGRAALVASSQARSLQNRCEAPCRAAEPFFAAVYPLSVLWINKGLQPPQLSSVYTAEGLHQ